MPAKKNNTSLLHILHRDDKSNTGLPSAPVSAVVLVSVRFKFLLQDHQTERRGLSFSYFLSSRRSMPAPHQLLKSRSITPSPRSPPRPRTSSPLQHNTSPHHTYTHTHAVLFLVGRRAFLRRVGVQILLISQVKSRDNNPFSFARDDKSYNSSCMMYDAHDHPSLEKKKHSPAANFSKITHNHDDGAENCRLSPPVPPPPIKPKPHPFPLVTTKHRE